MKDKSFLWLRPSRRIPASAGAILVIVAVCLGCPSAHGGGPPEWLVAAAGKPLPGSLDKQTNAVTLYSQESVVVKDSGEVEVTHREVVRIIRPGGRDEGKITVYFSPDNPVLSLKGWCIPASGKPYETRSEDIVEAAPYSYELYSDERVKILEIPAANPGNVIAYEYTQRDRRDFLETRWAFQSNIPVQESQFTLSLPPGWTYYTPLWWNHPRQEPSSLGAGQFSWTVENLPALKSEESMPAWAAISGSMTVAFSRAAEKGQLTGHTWNDIGAWYDGLVRPRQEQTAAIRAKVAELTAGAPSDWDRIQRLASYVQSQVRYVAIEIGIGGHQPHLAGDIFHFGYGDCKDKASLLSTMLGGIGIESHLVLINTERGAVVPEFPTRSFDHAILAIRLPGSMPAGHMDAETPDGKLGRLLFFDATDPYVPLGELPSILQANYGLVTYSGGGELIELPLAPAESNRLRRTGRFVLTPQGMLSGEILESSTGGVAAQERPDWESESEAERTRSMESYLGRYFTQPALASFNLKNLDNNAENLELHYRLETQDYARQAGNLLVLRPCVLGQYARNLMEGPEARTQPVEFQERSISEDDFTIALPSGFTVVDIPDAQNLVESFGEYHSSVTFSSGEIHYHRVATTKQIRIPVGDLPAYKQFERKIKADESAEALLQPGG